MNKLAILAIALGLIVACQEVGLAGQASQPFEPIHDIDLEGNKLNTPQCSDGWVPTSINAAICKPFGNKDPDILTSKHNQANANASASISQSVSLQNFTISSPNVPNAQTIFSTGASYANTQFTANYTNIEGQDVIQAGIYIPLNSGRKAVLQDVKISQALEIAKVCTAMVQANVDTSVPFDLLDCRAFKPVSIEVLPVPTVVDNDSEIARLRADFEKAKADNARLQMKIQQLLNAAPVGRLRG